MLKKWIDEIRAQSDLYKTNCWKYHISGNVIELSIVPDYLKKKTVYRCSVIAIGRVLQALSTKIELANLNFHIQSFPSLETPEIVASIRLYEKGDFTGKFGSQEKINQPQEASATITKLAKQYQLEIKEFEHLGNELLEEIPFKNYAIWYVVYSTFNNPFTWLKVGYLVESLRNEYLNQPEGKDFYLADLCSPNKDQYPNLRIPESKSLQSLIGIQPTNVKAG